MNTTQKLSEMILIQIAATGSIKAGYDAVMGEGAYDQLAGDLYDSLNGQEP